MKNPMFKDLVSFVLLVLICSFGFWLLNASWPTQVVFWAGSIVIAYFCIVAPYSKLKKKRKIKPSLETYTNTEGRLIYKYKIPVGEMSTREIREFIKELKNTLQSQESKDSSVPIKLKAGETSEISWTGKIEKLDRLLEVGDLTDRGRIICLVPDIHWRYNTKEGSFMPDELTYIAE